VALPGYVIGQISVDDLNVYLEKYGQPVAAQLAAAGGEVLVAAPDAAVVEGTWSGNWTVVIKFPSLDAARTWYESPEYAPLKRLRMDDLTSGGNVALADGFDPATLA